MAWIVALTTSGPMPSPGIEAMRYVGLDAMMPVLDVERS